MDSQNSTGPNLSWQDRVILQEMVTKAQNHPQTQALFENQVFNNILAWAVVEYTTQSEKADNAEKSVESLRARDKKVVLRDLLDKIMEATEEGEQA